MIAYRPSVPSDYSTEKCHTFGQIEFDACNSKYSPERQQKLTRCIQSEIMQDMTCFWGLTMSGLVE